MDRCMDGQQCLQGPTIFNQYMKHTCQRWKPCNNNCNGDNKWCIQQQEAKSDVWRAQSSVPSPQNQREFQQLSVVARQLAVLLLKHPVGQMMTSLSAVARQVQAQPMKAAPAAGQTSEAVAEHRRCAFYSNSANAEAMAGFSTTSDARITMQQHYICNYSMPT